MQIDLFPLIDLGDCRPAAGVDGCTKPIGRRNRPRRRRHPVPRKPSTIAGQLLELRAMVEQQHAELMDELRTLRQARRIEHESLPAILHRLVAIERHLGIVENPMTPRITRRRPLDG